MNTAAGIVSGTSVLALMAEASPEPDTHVNYARQPTNQLARLPGTST